MKSTKAMMMAMRRKVSCLMIAVRLSVTTKTSTPTKVDSKLSDAHLESLKRREGERGECHKGPE